MTQQRFLAGVACALVAACAASTPERQLIDGAATALGGRDRVLAVKTLVIEGEGSQFNLGQDMRPDASGQIFAVTGFKRQWDVPNRRWRMELTRTPEFAYFQGQAAQRQVQGIDGATGYNVAASGAASRVGSRVAEERRAEFYHHPTVIVAAALAPRATVANLRSQGAERLVDLTTEDGLRFVVAFDAAQLPTRVESRSYHANLGDVTMATLFSDYQEIDGMRLPSRMITRVDDFTTSDLRLARNLLNGATDELAAPAEVAAAAEPVAASPNVVPEAIAPGVWLLAGQSHHSALVELSDRLLLIEAPQSEARTLAVIAKARELQPQKPITDLITTHHHFDHTAGLRAAIAEGLRVTTHEGNRAFVETMAKRPHTISADALSRNPKPVVVETVGDESVIRDAMRTVAIYHVAGNPHSDTMLMVHLPAERVLIEVDAFSPTSQVHPYAANLLENITRRGLRVDRIVPLHGPIAPFSALTKLRPAPAK